MAGLRELLFRLLDLDERKDPEEFARVDQFIQVQDAAISLALWIGDIDQQDSDATEVARRIRNLLQRDIATIDELIDQTLNQILHSPVFQDIEARWRGLKSLVIHDPRKQNVRIRILDVTWAELRYDAETAIEYDHSLLFRKVYDEEFGSPGGIPFSLLIGDYSVSHRFDDDVQRGDDITTLESISGVAAAAFAPFVAAASPRLFGADSFAELVRGIRLDVLFAERQYLRWSQLRTSPDSRYLGLVVPRTLCRAPYSQEQLGSSGFIFSESRVSDEGENRLWGSGVFPFAMSCIQSFVQTGWFEGIVGHDGPGALGHLPRLTEEVDESVHVSPVEVTIDEEFNRDLSVHGFMSLRRSKFSEQIDFASVSSLYQARPMADPAIMNNELLSAQMNLLLGVARFAHYVKIYSRNLIGSGHSPGQIQTQIHNWLAGYTAVTGNVPEEVRSQYPLTAFKVEVWERAGAPGSYLCELFLRPHSQVHMADIDLQFQTEL